MSLRVDLITTLEDPAWAADPPREVFVDGECLAWCIAFDQAEGWADYIVCDEKGRPARDACGKLMLARIRGHVTVLRESEP